MMKIVGFAVATMFPRLGAAKVTMERLSIQQLLQQFGGDATGGLVFSVEKNIHTLVGGLEH